jgi:long-chain acyl-CoA synthetase
MIDQPWLENYDPGVPHNINYPSYPLHTFLTESALNYPDQPCTVSKDDVITFREMESLSNQFAQALLRMDCTKGDRVGIILPNIPEFIIAFYGISKMGGVISAINPQYHDLEMTYQIKDSGIEIALVMDVHYSSLKHIQADTPLKKIIVVQTSSHFSLILQKNRMQIGQNDAWFDQIIENEPDDGFKPSNVNSNDPVIFQYTGGTTGTPKGAIGLHRNLVANTLQFRHWLINTQMGREVFLVAIPMYHVYGMVLGMSLAIASGASMVLVSDPRDLTKLLEVIEKYQVTIFPGVPNLYNSILRIADVNEGKCSLKSIRICISGSAPLNEKTKRDIESLIGGRVCEGYGLSEAPTATHCNPILGKNKIGSIGLPLPDVDCRIVNIEDGVTPVNPNENGELLLRGPQIMAGYHQKPFETFNVLKDGWLYTGDIARMDEDGYFFLVGRKKDVLKVGGFQVWPREIEEILSTHPKILEVAIAGVPEQQGEEKVIAWIVVKPGETISKDEVREWCKQYLVHYKVPSFVEFRDQLPKTTVGKILRNELVREYLESNPGLRKTIQG